MNIYHYLLQLLFGLIDTSNICKSDTTSIVVVALVLSPCCTLRKLELKPAHSAQQNPYVQRVHLATKRRSSVSANHPKNRTWGFLLAQLTPLI